MRSPLDDNVYSIKYKAAFGGSYRFIEDMGPGQAACALCVLVVVAAPKCFVRGQEDEPCETLPSEIHIIKGRLSLYQINLFKNYYW